jgi:hypothetical protein
MSDVYDGVLDVLAAVSVAPAPESSCDHRWAFVPPARFNRPGASLPPRCDRYARDGLRICRLCGAWADAELGDVERYEGGEIKDILVYWGRRRGRKRKK